MRIVRKQTCAEDFSGTSSGLHPTRSNRAQMRLPFHSNNSVEPQHTCNVSYTSKPLGRTPTHTQFSVFNGLDLPGCTTPRRVSNPCCGTAGRHESLITVQMSYREREGIKTERIKEREGRHWIQFQIQCGVQTRDGYVCLLLCVRFTGMA